MSNQKRAMIMLAGLIVIGMSFRSIAPVKAASAASLNSGSFLMPLFDPPLILVVTSTADPGDGTCDSDCTLREAMNDANVAPDMNTITFAIPGVSVHTIQPATALPVVSFPVIIDGTTQPGYVNSPLIEINGVNLGPNPVPTSVGINITGGGTTVRGLAINGFAYGGVGIIFGGSNVVEANFIGTDATGTIAKPNLYGVIIYQSSNNTVGGLTAAKRNIISGNQNDGVNVGHASSTGNQIIGNYIGVNAAGTAALGNNDKGVKVEDSINTIIGGTQAGAGNIIAASGLYGVFLKDTSGNVVQGNWIGTNPAGAALGNTSFGVYMLGGSSDTIGGTAAGGGNVIAFNTGAGVDAEPFNAFVATNNIILGNSIHDNDGMGIDLGGDGVSANDVGDGDTGVNDLQNYPVLTSITTTATSVTINGTLNSLPNASYRVEFFDNTVCDASGNGEGQTYLGSSQVSTDGSGNATFNVTFSHAVAPGDAITMTATDAANNTSEFSACVTPANAVLGRNYFTTRTPTLTWNPVTGALGYEVEVSANSAFSGTLIVDDNTLTPDTLSKTITVPKGGVYYWRVRTKLPNGQWNPVWSAAEIFTVAG